MAQSERLYEIQVESNVPVPMRDGTILRAAVYRPKTEHKCPVIVMRNGYDPLDDFTVEWGTFFSQRGYVFVFNNTRGTFQSEGEFFPFVDDSWGKNRDGYDTIEWAGHQSWSDGTVGMFGISYGAFTQYITVPTLPPSLKTCFPIFGSSAKDVAFQHGAYRLQEHRGWAVYMALCCLQSLTTPENRSGTRALLENTEEEIEDWFRHLPLKDFPPLENLSSWNYEHLSRLTDVRWWNQTDARTQFGEIGVPMCHVGGWYDLYLSGTLDHYTGLVEHGRSEACRSTQRLIIGPWPHDDNALPPKPLDFGGDATIKFHEVALPWFDYWLKGNVNGVLDEPGVRLFLMGENRWLEMDRWPPADVTYTDIHFREGAGKTEQSLNSGQLTFELPNANEEPDAYKYDPADPIIGRGPTSETDELSQNEKEGRLLTYTTEVLQDPVCVIGPVKAKIFASSSAPDTDWVVRLCDVYPDGTSIKVCDGILRARFRNSLQREEFMEPDEVYELEIDMTATAQTFLAGHRIRIQVTSSNFPWFDRNLNTGGPFGEEAEGQVAINTIYHDAERPSHVILPIMKS